MELLLGAIIIAGCGLIAQVLKTGFEKITKAVDDLRLTVISTHK